MPDIGEVGPTFEAMPRTLALDFGMKRSGLAISDPTDTIANGLDTVETHRLMDRLRQLMNTHAFERIVIGHPRRMDGTDFSVETNIGLFIEAFLKIFPQVEVIRVDERFTSRIAQRVIQASGVNRKARQDKGTVDKVSATLLLQEFISKS